jgi:threonine synthase
LRRDVSSISIDDPTIQHAIRTGQERYGRMFDPHTATAVYAVDELGIEDPIVVSTAHPAKFGSVVGPLVEGAIETPESLVRIRERASHFVEIAPDIEELRRALR